MGNHKDKYPMEVDLSLRQIKQSFRATDVKWAENSRGEEGFCNINYDILINRTSAGINSFEFVLISITGIEIRGNIINKFAEYKVTADIHSVLDISPKSVFIDPISKTIEIHL
jgi:hypothetical protein